MSTNKVLLVYPYFYNQHGTKDEKVFAPLGIGLLSAILKKSGVEVSILDCTFLSFEDAVKAVQLCKPDITGFYTMTTQAKNTLCLIDQFKEVNPDSVYIAGGPLPTIYPEKFSEKFDYVFRGEAAISLPRFCLDYMASAERTMFLRKMDASNYSGIYSTEPVHMDVPPVHLTKEEIDECPITDREGFDHKMYQDACCKVTGKKTATIMTTYGCPFLCDFCSKPIYGNEIRYRNLNNVMKEIRDILSYGYDSLWIADDLFTFNTDFLKSFCGRLLDEEIQVSWSCLSRVDYLTDDVAKMMKKAGCFKVYLGIESGNDEILKLMNKKINIQQVKKGIEIFRNNGLDCAGFFIVGYPGETVDTIEETFHFALSLGLDEISFNVPYPLPGSSLYERVVDLRKDDWVAANEVKFLYKSEFDEVWIKRRIHETLEEFVKQKGCIVFI